MSAARILVVDDEELIRSLVERMRADGYDVLEAGTGDQALEHARDGVDLFYRLNVLPITLPPLRQHLDDVPPLVGFDIDGFNREFRKTVKGVSLAAMKQLQSYGWPGNIRELRNAVERAMLLAGSDSLEPVDFPLVNIAGRDTSVGFQLPALGVNLDALEESLVRQALERSGGNQTRAAVLLGMNRDQIRYRMEKYALAKPGT